LFYLLLVHFVYLGTSLGSVSGRMHSGTPLFVLCSNGKKHVSHNLKLSDYSKQLSASTFAKLLFLNPCRDLVTANFERDFTIPRILPRIWESSLLVFCIFD
jgi:hypothetical protein